jgi:hypothetical protein
MSTNEEVLTHLQGLTQSANNAVNTVNEWRRFSSMMTAGAKTAELAKITTVPVERLHASDCAICTAWDGTD